MESGAFEADEVTELLRLFGNESITHVINVGANCGYYACLARQHGLAVMAVEPMPLNVRILLRNLMNNGWGDVEVFPVGVAEKPGLTKIFGVGTQASLLAGWASDNSKHYHLIPVTTLDHIVGNRGGKKLFIVDIEGAEYRLLQGADEQLRLTPRPVWMIEICINQFQPEGVPLNPNLLPTFEIFWNLGYDGYVIGDEPRRPVTRARVTDWTQGKNLPPSHNFIFKRQRSS